MNKFIIWRCSSRALIPRKEKQSIIRSTLRRGSGGPKFCGYRSSRWELVRGRGRNEKEGNRHKYSLKEKGIVKVTLGSEL
jgi:hypothetical protein